jgi:hypothetical protein
MVPLLGVVSRAGSRKQAQKKEKHHEESLQVFVQPESGEAEDASLLVPPLDWVVVVLGLYKPEPKSRLLAVTRLSVRS